MSSWPDCIFCMNSIKPSLGSDAPDTGAADAFGALRRCAARTVSRQEKTKQDQTFARGFAALGGNTGAERSGSGRLFGTRAGQRTNVFWSSDAKVRARSATTCSTDVE
jgi:hypothetical protein